MRILMLVATSVAGDARVLREASSLVAAGHQVHIIGKSVPTGWEPPQGVTVASIGTSSVFRSEEGQSLSGRRLAAPLRLARWLLLPEQRRSAYGRWARDAYFEARDQNFDVVHVHDFTALGVGSTLAEQHRVPLVYDSHEMWSQIRRSQRPTPVQRRRELRKERRWGGQAQVVITVGDGVAAALRKVHGWTNVVVVRNTFPVAPGSAPETPNSVIYAGRIGEHRDLETVAIASEALDLPVRLMGPADQTWLAGFARGRSQVEPSRPIDEVPAALQSAGIALVTLEDSPGNHRLALPNKVFHAVSCGVPVVASDVGELGALVRAHRIGQTYRAGDPADLRRAVAEVVTDYAEYCRNVETARIGLSWPTDEERLLAAYRQLEVQDSPTTSPDDGGKAKE